MSINGQGNLDPLVSEPLRQNPDRHALLQQQGCVMSTDRPNRDSMSVEEATVSNMWEIAAIVEMLERKGLFTKQESVV